MPSFIHGHPNPRAFFAAGMAKTATLIDGAFFLKRLPNILPKEGTGDSDFVPAAKLAQREGIDFILDPMWNRLKPELEEHIDGLINKTPKPAKTS